MKIAVFGGSFNPIHMGHLSLAGEVVALGYDKVLFVPASSAPHKKMAFPLSAEKRIRMVSLAIEDEPHFELETCEIDRGGISYTWDTVCHLEKKYSVDLEGKIALIMGRDQAASFHLWKNADKLSEKCTLILGERPFQVEDEGFMNASTGKYAECEGSYARKFKFDDEPLFKNAVILKNEALAISSTEIRKRAATGLPFEHLVPEKVFKYIIDGNVYGKNE